MRRALSTAAAALAVALVATLPTAAATAAPSQRPDDSRHASHFGRMFPDVPGLTSQSNQDLADLAQTMLDPNADSENNPDPDMTSVYTYFGQFVDHDLTSDSTPQPTAPVDPTTLTNGRTFRFDLDSVYGGGPDVSPKLYEADRAHFRVQTPNSSGAIDLPRNADGSAILVEPRNDENEIISQIHTTFLLLHNKAVDRGLSFAQAQRRTIDLYQWLIIHDILPHFVGDALSDQAINGKLPQFYKPGSPGAAMTPIEFTVASYRFGHSMIRRAYELTNSSGKIQVFSASLPDLRGGRALTADRQIDWGNFVAELTRPANVAHVNKSRKIDTLISSSLFVLPIPGAEASGSNVLAFRNLTRAKFYNLPSGQAIAAAMGITPIPPDVIGLDAAFDNGTPLWYYTLFEASRATDGKTLGPVGGRIVADVFGQLLRTDKDSIVRGERKFRPSAPESDNGEFGLEDLFVAAGLAQKP